MHGASDKSCKDFIQDSRLQAIARIFPPLGNDFFLASYHAISFMVAKKWYI
jgi:hypothetical protein